MQADTVVTRQENPEAEAVREAKRLVAEAQGLPFTQYRPLTRDDFGERANVTEVTIALRKEELLRQLLAGKRTREAAKCIGVAVGTARTYIQCEEFQKKLRAASEKIWTLVDEELRQSKLSSTLRIRELSEMALENIERLMQSDDETISLRATTDILDRNPDTSKHSKSDNTNTQFTLDPAQLILAHQVALEMEGRRHDSTRTATIDGSPSPSESASAQ